MTGGGAERRRADRARAAEALKQRDAQPRAGGGTISWPGIDTGSSLRIQTSATRRSADPPGGLYRSIAHKLIRGMMTGCFKTARLAFRRTSRRRAWNWRRMSRATGSSCRESSRRRGRGGDGTVRRDRGRAGRGRAGLGLFAFETFPRLGQELAIVFDLFDGRLTFLGPAVGLGASLPVGRVEFRGALPVLVFRFVVAFGWRLVVLGVRLADARKSVFDQIQTLLDVLAQPFETLAEVRGVGPRRPATRIGVPWAIAMAGAV